MKKIRAVLCIALFTGAISLLSACVHEVIKPVADTRLFVTHVGDTAILTWQSKAGEEYSAWYTAQVQQGSPAGWQVLPGCEHISGTGATIERQDIVPGGNMRYYRIVTKPATPSKK